MRGGLPVLLGALVAGGCAAAVELDMAAPPTYGTVTLEAGFMPDPHIVAVDAGGPDATPDLGAGCIGRVNAAAPDVDLFYTGGDYRLTIYVRSDADTTLVVNAPDGSWHCSDDDDGRDPLLSFGRPRTGLYSIWVGTYGRALASALLHISERDPRGRGDRTPVAGDIVTGSGFFVTAKGRLVTNAHVVEGCRSIEIGGHGAARVVTADAAADLALLEFVPGAGRTAAVPVAVLSSVPPRLGADVVLLGYPLSHLLDGSLNVTTGVVSGLAGLARDPQRFQLTAPLQQGNSGGPVLDEAGLVIGVAVAKLDEMAELERSGSLPQNINFAIRASVVVAFLDRAGVVAKTAPGGPALSRTAISERGAAFTVQVRCAT